MDSEMRINLKYILALAFAVSSVNAFSIPNGFVYLTSSEDMDIYYGSVLSKDGREAFISTHEVFKDQSKILESSVISEVDCSNPQVRTVTRIIYFSNGKILKPDNKIPPGQWNYAGKGTVGARLFEKVCGHYPK